MTTTEVENLALALTNILFTEQGSLQISGEASEGYFLVAISSKSNFTRYITTNDLIEFIAVCSKFLPLLSQKLQQATDDRVKIQGLSEQIYNYNIERRVYDSTSSDK